MAKYILTRNAKRDLAAIADYTIGKFGIQQARRYEHKKTFDLLFHDRWWDFNFANPA